MKTRISLALAVMGTVATFATLPAAAAEPRAPGGGQAASADDLGRYGSAVGYGSIDREIRLHPDTKSVTVWRLEIIEFVTADGRAFAWRFDGTHPVVFPLARIAPPDVSVPAGTTVYVRPKIPVAP